MTNFPPTPSRDEYDQFIETLAERVLDEHTEVAADTYPELVKHHDFVHPDDEILNLNKTEKYEVISVFVHTDLFDKAIQGFHEYGDNDRLNDADWSDIRERSGGPASYRKHAERLAYYEILDQLKDDPRTVN